MARCGTGGFETRPYTGVVLHCTKRIVGVGFKPARPYTGVVRR